MNAEQRTSSAQIFTLFALALLLSYFYRGVNAILESHLRADVPSLDKESIGFLTGGFFLAFALGQLPVGVLLDRFGPRRVQSALLLVAAAGAVLFASASGEASLFAGRAMIGLGMSACLMAAFKAFAIWFPAERLPTLNGWVMAVGSAGMMAATWPVQVALQAVDWRWMFLGLAALTIGLAAAIWALIPEMKPQTQVESSGAMLRGLRAIWANRFFWRIMPFAMIGQGGIMALQTLWMGPWLLEVRGLDEEANSLALLLMAGAQLLALLLVGRIAALARPLGVSALGLAVASLVFGLIVVAAIAVGSRLFSPLFLLVCLGISSAGSTLLFAGMTQVVPIALSGRLTTSMNLLVFGTVFVVQWLIGLAIELYLESGLGSEAEAFSAAFLGLAVAQAFALMWFLANRHVVPSYDESKFARRPGF